MFCVTNIKSLLFRFPYPYKYLIVSSNSRTINLTSHRIIEMHDHQIIFTCVDNMIACIISILYYTQNFHEIYKLKVWTDGRHIVFFLSLHIRIREFFTVNPNNFKKYLLFVCINTYIHTRMYKMHVCIIISIIYATTLYVASNVYFTIIKVHRSVYIPTYIICIQYI